VVPRVLGLVPGPTNSHILGTRRRPTGLHGRRLRAHARRGHLLAVGTRLVRLPSRALGQPIGSSPRDRPGEDRDDGRGATGGTVRPARHSPKGGRLHIAHRRARSGTSNAVAAPCTMNMYNVSCTTSG